MTSKPEAVPVAAKQRGSMGVFTATIIGLLIAFAVYYIFYVRRQTDYFVGRNLRLLSTIARQTEGGVKTQVGIVSRESAKGGSAIAQQVQQAVMPTERWSLDEVFTRICTQKFANAFDQLVIADSNGRVVRSCKEAVRLTSFDQLVELHGWNGKESTLDFGRMQRVPVSTKIALGEGDYRLFAQPLRLPDEITDGVATTPDGATKSTAWIVAGMTSEARFDQESLSISYTFLIACLGLLALAIFSLPFVRLGLIGKLQRVRLADVLLLGVCTVLGVATLTIVLLDTVTYRIVRNVTDGQLRKLAGDLETHVLEELSAVSAVLDVLDRQLPGSGQAEPLDVADFYLPEIEAYPHFESFYRIEESGWQVFKRSTEPRTTDLVNVGTRKYFQDAMAGRATLPQRFVVESIRSMTTGVTQAVISRQSVRYVPAQTGQHPAVAAVAFPMVSLIDPVVAGGYEFAVIDEKGQVLFHSDSQRNTFENFFEETDHDRSLAAAVFGRQDVLLNIRYWGSDYRAYVTPLRDTPWMLVTLRDKRLLRALNVETIVITVVFFGLYVLLFALVLATMAVVRPLYRAPWLWFDRRKAYDYRRLIYAYWAFGVSFAVSIYLFRTDVLIFVAFLIPSLALLVTYIRLRRLGAVDSRVALVVLAACFLALIVLALDGGNAEPGVLLNKALLAIIVVASATAGVLAALLPPWRIERTRSGDPRRHLLVPGYAYAIAGASLLTLVAILPTVAFFKSAFRLEMQSYVKLGQLELSAALEGRDANLSARRNQLVRDAVEIDRSLIGRVERLTVERREETLGLYYRFLFDTDIGWVMPAAQSEESKTADAWTGWLFARQDELARPGRASPIPAFLERVLPHYSRESVRMRELLHDAAGDGEWHSVPRGGALELTKKRVEGGMPLVISSTVPRVLPFLWQKLAPGQSRLVTRKPRFVDPHEHPEPPRNDEFILTAVHLALLAFLLTAYASLIVWIIRFINRRVFLIDVDEPHGLDANDRIESAVGDNMLIFTGYRPRSLASINEASFIPVEPALFAKDAPRSAWQQVLTRVDLERRGLLVEELDQHWSDEGWRMNLLRFLEAATADGHRRTIVVTEVSPWVLFHEMEPSEAARWAEIFSTFTVRVDDGRAARSEPVHAAWGQPLSESLAEIVAMMRAAVEFVRRRRRRSIPLVTTMQLVARRAMRGIRRFLTPERPDAIAEWIDGSDANAVMLIDRECSGSGFLADLGAELKAKRHIFGEEQLYDEIGERAAGHYRSIWSRLSAEEKVVVQHIAEDGFANVNDRRILRRLLARGIVRRSPHFEVMNETFRRFAIGDKRRKEVEALHARAGFSTWDRIEKPLMAVLVAAAVFFVATQRELFDATMATVTAVATGIPAFVRLAAFVAEPKGVLGLK